MMYLGNQLDKDIQGIFDDMVRISKSGKIKSEVNELIPDVKKILKSTKKIKGNKKMSRKLTVYEKCFLKNCDKFNLRREWLGESVYVYTKEYKIIGMVSNRKHNIILKLKDVNLKDDLRISSKVLKAKMLNNHGHHYNVKC